MQLHQELIDIRIGSIGVGLDEFNDIICVFNGNIHANGFDNDTTRGVFVCIFFLNSFLLLDPLFDYPCTMFFCFVLSPCRYGINSIRCNKPCIWWDIRN